MGIGSDVVGGGQGSMVPPSNDFLEESGPSTLYQTRPESFDHPGPDSMFAVRMAGESFPLGNDVSQQSNPVDHGTTPTSQMNSGSVSHLSTVSNRVLTIFNRDGGSTYVFGQSSRAQTIERHQGYRPILPNGPTYNRKLKKELKCGACRKVYTNDQSLRRHKNDVHHEFGRSGRPPTAHREVNIP